MNIYTITAGLIAIVVVPVIASALLLIRQDAANSRRDDRWLGRHR